jgi:predicted nucleic acid-binding protein
VARIFWDTNLFIYMLEEHPEFEPVVTRIFENMRRRGDHLITSALTLGEVLTRPLATGDTELEQQYRALFQPPEVTIAPFDIEAAGHYGRIRQDRTIRPPDAIQLACAARGGAALFITNDERLSRKTIAGLPFVTSLARSPV